MTNTYSALPNQRIHGANGVDYAYREIGDGGTVPLVLLQHFRGNLDNWDPLLIDALASARRVVTFDNRRVGGTSGVTPNSIEQMAQDAISFLTAMELDQVDVLGFPIGSFVAQEIAPTQAGPRAPAGSGVFGAERGGRDARLGTGCHRRRGTPARP